MDVEEWRGRLLRNGGFVMHPAAERFLQEFGGLKVEVDNLGSGITVGRASFDLDPALAVFEGDRFSRFVSETGSALFPVGEIDHGHGFFALGESGLLAHG